LRRSKSQTTDDTARSQGHISRLLPPDSQQASSRSPARLDIEELIHRCRVDLVEVPYEQASKTTTELAA
jgi:hypothetical protein